MIETIHPDIIELFITYLQKIFLAMLKCYVSLGQKYLTTADPFDPTYNTPDQHRDLKKLTCPTI